MKLHLLFFLLLAPATVGAVDTIHSIGIGSKSWNDLTYLMQRIQRTPQTPTEETALFMRRNGLAGQRVYQFSTHEFRAMTHKTAISNPLTRFSLIVDPWKIECLPCLKDATYKDITMAEVKKIGNLKLPARRMSLLLEQEGASKVSKFSAGIHFRYGRYLIPGEQSILGISLPILMTAGTDLPVPGYVKSHPAQWHWMRHLTQRAISFSANWMRR